MVRRVIVVSNNSVDATVERAIAAGAITVNETVPGYGRCVYRCFTEALNHDSAATADSPWLSLLKTGAARDNTSLRRQTAAQPARLAPRILRNSIARWRCLRRRTTRLCRGAGGHGCAAQLATAASLAPAECGERLDLRLSSTHSTRARLSTRCATSLGSTSTHPTARTDNCGANNAATQSNNLSGAHFTR